MNWQTKFESWFKTGDSHQPDWWSSVWVRRALVVLAILALTLPALARLGGGSSYRSSSRSSSSSSRSSSSYRSSSSRSSSGYSSGSYRGGGGGGGGGWLFFLIVDLVAMAYVYITALEVKEKLAARNALGVPGPAMRIAGTFFGLLIFGAFGGITMCVLALMAALGDSGRKLLESSSADRFLEPPPDLKPLLESDPNFSLPVFREFGVLLYCQAMQEAPARFEQSSAYLAEQPKSKLQSSFANVTSIDQVIVGQFKLQSARQVGDQIVAQVEIESNYRVMPGNKYFVSRETWSFSRKRGVLTRAPEQVVKLSCPGCGYPGEIPSSGDCPQCGQSNRRGQIDWQVSGIQTLSGESFDPKAVSGSAEEAGTNSSTLRHPHYEVRKREFLARHPEFSFEAFSTFVKESFLSLQRGWSERDLNQLRPHETDSLYRTHRFWIENYKEGGLINQLSDIKVARVEGANIVMDAFYESITVRIWASMKDVTFYQSDGRVLAGSSSKTRSFSEYWTFIRRAGAKDRSAGDFQSCPSCAAPLDKVSQAGVCEYCDSLITLGDFDWVLSNIEQDEVYQPQP